MIERTPSDTFARLTPAEQFAHAAALDAIQKAHDLPLSRAKTIAVEQALKPVDRARAVATVARFRPMPDRAAGDR